ncbi:hypothetical protein PIROE2DRAFT_1312 [Piromyces sp. E2]|nr:hypothetical protein PIROE2DRAFT_1312 [Piromyces sp. E2]|eukprot:OUM70452.1 hypothetical protein PIROE2DRAFT_1312 [Piromyces sp. E2]
MNINITKEIIDTFIKKEKQNEEKFIELFPSVDPSKMKELFESENNEINDDIIINTFEYIENNDNANVLIPNNNVRKNNKNDMNNSYLNIKSDIFNELNTLEKCDSAVTLIKCTDDEDNEKHEEFFKINSIRSDGNKYMEFFNRSKKSKENNINKDNMINNESQNEKSYISNSLVLPFKKIDISKNLLPNSIDNTLSEYSKFNFNSNVNNSNKNYSINLTNEYNNTQQQESIIKKLQKLILKQENKESNNTLLKQENKESNNILLKQENKESNNTLLKQENKKSNNTLCFNDDLNIKISINNNDPDIILSKVKKYGEEMDQIQNEIMRNYQKQLISSLNNKDSNKTHKKEVIEKIDEPIEEISLKADFFKTSNLSFSRKELDKKSIKDEKYDETETEIYNKSSKPFLKVDNYVTWEE